MGSEAGRSPPRRKGSLLALALAIASWQALSLLRFGGRPVIASPWQTLSALPSSLGGLGADLSATAARAGAGLAVGSVAGVALGLAAAVLLRRAPAIEGLLDFARSIPPVVLLPMLLLAAGYGDVARVANVALGCVWTMALAVTTAAAAPRSARRELLELAGARRLQALAWTEPWESLGVLAVGLRTSASMAVVIAVVTEMVVGAERGIGSRVIAAQIASDTPGLTLAVVAIGAVGYGLNLGLRRFEAWARGLAG